MLISNDIHKSWQPFLTEEIVDELKLIESKLGDSINPEDPSKILRFLSVDLSKVKVIWLGQDVYPSIGVATGRAFEVGNLISWTESFRQVSLKNIIRLIHKNYNGIDRYEHIKKYSNIKEEMQSGEFKIKPPIEWFDSLEQQGVLFLNTAFTCEVGIPNSHKELWSHFSQKVLQYISVRNPNVIWFLWGKEAISNKEYIQGQFFESRHPSRVSEKYEDDFLKFEGFKETMNQINWLG